MIQFFMEVQFEMALAIYSFLITMLAVDIIVEIIYS